ncbi:MAG: hypothetical protein IJH04_09330, partial [Eggerthellaceae bacterium]|nr:hypothetical protein [Eggerthellaceae bacterium]
LPTLYGNLLADGLAAPQIIVGVDMYTDKLADKSDKTNEELRFIYDKVVDDIAIDLMPFIEQNYSAETGRSSAAVAGVSQGASEALCTGFKWLDKFGYIGSFSSDPGVIPTEFFKGSFWNVPYFQQFPTPTASNEPFYLYLSVGTEDPWNVGCTRYYGEVLDEAGIRNQTDIIPGFAHEDAFWEQCFYNLLTKAFK